MTSDSKHDLTAADLKKIAVGALFPALATVFFSWFAETFQAPNGNATVSSVAVSDTSSTLVITLANFTSKIDEELVFTVPSAVEARQIRTQSPLRLTLDSASGASGRLLHISGIERGKSTAVIIALPIAQLGYAVSLVNEKDVDWQLRKDRSIGESTLRRWTPTAVGATTSYVLVFLILLGARKELARQLGDIDTRVDLLKADSEKTDKSRADMEATLRAQLAHLRRGAKRVDRRLALNRHILLRRLSDSQAELAFWRNAMRRLVWSAGHGEQAAQRSVEVVTEALQTWHAREPRPGDLEVSMITNWLSEDRDSHGAYRRELRELRKVRDAANAPLQASTATAPLAEDPSTTQASDPS